MEVARSLNEPVFVTKRKFRILSCLDWPLEDMARLTTDASKARYERQRTRLCSVLRVYRSARQIVGCSRRD